MLKNEKTKKLMRGKIGEGTVEKNKIDETLEAVIHIESLYSLCFVCAKISY